MKRLNLLLGIFIGLTILSCSSDDDNQNQTKSNFTLNGTEYSIPNGFILSAFDGTNNSRHAIYLINGIIINNEWYGVACDYSNDLTQGIIFNITSSSVTELANGTYNYELMTTEPSLNETNIVTNIVVENNCVISSNDINENQITSGSLTVERTNNIYTLNFTFETNDFGTVSGSYVGELQLTQDLSD
ncbi:hypothetical protein V8G69_04575 [Gaetbulibacter sp. M235]|uniref:hypothetical protein n=1 Tax=Gaetbulibacter sp. M235 TaxID=3126510 RepID=UPI00374F5A9B